MGAAAEIALCPVNTVSQHKLSFFYSPDERHRATWPLSHLYHSYCLENRVPLPFLLACYPSWRERLRNWQPQLLDPGADDAEGQGSPRQRSGEWRAVVTNNKRHVCSVLPERHISQTQRKPAKIQLSTLIHQECEEHVRSGSSQRSVLNQAGLSHSL